MKFDDGSGILRDYKLINKGRGIVTIEMLKDSPIYVKFAEKTGEGTWDSTKGELKLSDCNYYMQEKTD